MALLEWVMSLQFAHINKKKLIKLGINFFEKNFYFRFFNCVKNTVNIRLVLFLSFINILDNFFFEKA